MFRQRALHRAEHLDQHFLVRRAEPVHLRLRDDLETVLLRFGERVDFDSVHDVVEWENLDCAVFLGLLDGGGEGGGGG